MSFPQNKIAMTELDVRKNKVANEMGYTSFNEYYNWVARDNELPSVVAQQVEAFMDRVVAMTLIDNIEQIKSIAKRTEYHYLLEKKGIIKMSNLIINDITIQLMTIK